MKDKDSIDIADLSMLDLFRIELENYTKLLEVGLVEVEQNSVPEKIEPLMRAAHSIKGAARIVGLDLVVSLAHAIEDVLSAAQHGKMSLSSDDIDLLLKGNDLFVRLAAVEIRSMPQWLKDEAESIDKISQSIRGILTGKTPDIPNTKNTRPSTIEHEEPPRISQEKIPVPEKREDVLKAKPLEKEEDSFVRVVSESLNRLMGFAGECLVQARSTKPFSVSLLKIKDWHLELGNLLGSIFESAKSTALSKEVRERFSESLKQFDQINDLLVEQIVDFEHFSRNLERLADKLYNEVVEIRMRPFSDGLPGFPRMVRDIAKKMGKRANFEILGETTRIDRDILEKLEAPLTHLIRNAIDHGLETPEERLAANKKAEGTLTLEARHSSGMLYVRVSDDGRGIDIERLRQKVVEKGHTSREIATNLLDGELFDFLFLPGFSTANAVTEVSGRGVGLDVVMSMVQEVGGTVRVDTKPGQGTSFYLQLPLTLSVLRTLIVDIGDEPYAIPLSRIDRIIESSPDRLKILEDKQFYVFENEHIGIVDAHQVLQIPAPDDKTQALFIVVISDRLNRYGLVVDNFIGERELVVIPLDARLGRIPNVSAGAILEDGSPVLILDVDDLVRSIDNLLTHGRLHKVGERNQVSEGKRKRVLVVDDSLTVREVERRLLENSGYDVTVAVDGVDGWNTLQLKTFDLVISDIDMPRMNGIELIKKIKSDPRLRQIPVIIVSYKDREEDRIKGLEAGANYYLTKSSFQDKSLNIAVRDMIGEP
ncbi:MAG TPA: hybrid sensor histidine kinase/response regulator [Syntrophorhabdaceae bacterium]|nr:hybrid sensor histidine kinase/response regulator [Syntrophorhabdaceae bacterium]HQP51846.1 hybrid sensor histidine kinase/response regulator [Syntrophorhabdaceae bacterium]